MFFFSHYKATNSPGLGPNKVSTPQRVSLANSTGGGSGNNAKTAGPPVLKHQMSTMSESHATGSPSKQNVAAMAKY